MRDIAIIGVGLMFSALALAQLGCLPPLVIIVLYAFLSIRVEDSSILDFLWAAAKFLFWDQQYYEWRQEP